MELDSKIAATLENLVEALRTPEDYPARQEYIAYLMAKADVYILERNAKWIGEVA